MQHINNLATHIALLFVLGLFNVMEVLTVCLQNAEQDYKKNKNFTYSNPEINTQLKLPMLLKHLLHFSNITMTE